MIIETKTSYYTSANQKYHQFPIYPAATPSDASPMDVDSS